MINHNYIEERVASVAAYVIETKATIRQAAHHFGVSKSTVHKDVTERLPQVKPNLVPAVHEVLNTNLNERHIRGGMATRRKFKGE
jgi:putative DeoR family transcriptional regulator (stage III sporulation protein D)